MKRRQCSRRELLGEEIKVQQKMLLPDKVVYSYNRTIQYVSLRYSFDDQGPLSRELSYPQFQCDKVCKREHQIRLIQKNTLMNDNILTWPHKYKNNVHVNLSNKEDLKASLVEMIILTHQISPME